MLLLHLNETKAASVLPGQQVWSGGISSFLFGANDASWQWSQTNLGNSPIIATTVRTAGITIIRTPLHSNDAQARVAALEATGAQCLGILQPADAEQVVQSLGSRCKMYEWMNEPDNGGPTADQYAASWNQEIPKLRALNPQAIFIGPVVAFPDTKYIQTFLTAAKASGNLPDLVSYHMYPCTDQTISSCPTHIADFAKATAAVNAAVSMATGQRIPLAVTEWNYSWKPSQTPQHDPYMATFTQQSLQAMAQAGIVLANQFDIASNAGEGSLDMVDTHTAQGTPQLQVMQQMIAQVRGSVPAATASVSPTQTISASPSPSATGTGGGTTITAPLLLGRQVVCQTGNIQPTIPAATTAPLPSTSSTPTSLGCTLQQPLTTGQYLVSWWPLDTADASSMSISSPSGTITENASGGARAVQFTGAGMLQVSFTGAGSGTLIENVAIYQLPSANALMTVAPVYTGSPTISATP